MSYVWLKLNLSFVGYQSLLYHLMVNELWNYFLLRLILPNIEMYLKTKLIMRYLHTQPCTFSRKTFKSEGNKIYIWYVFRHPLSPKHIDFLLCTTDTMLDTTTRKQIPYIVSVATNCNKFTPMHKYKKCKQRLWYQSVN